MKLLEENILKYGIVLNNDVLKVDSFLNHQLDIELLDKLGFEFFQRFKSENINKILTIEASGIALASLTARHFGVPVVFAKKSSSINISKDVYSTPIESFTHQKTYNVLVSKEYINEGDNILIIDDFLATGNALFGLIDLVNQANANVVGLGIAIEKYYQNGGKQLRDKGYKLESLAIIDSLSDKKVIFKSLD